MCLVPALGSFELHETIFSNLVACLFGRGYKCGKSGGPVGKNFFAGFCGFVRRMKSCIDEFRPNTSQANYFEGFWRIKS